MVIAHRDRFRLDPSLEDVIVHLVLEARGAPTSDIETVRRDLRFQAHISQTDEGGKKTIHRITKSNARDVQYDSGYIPIKFITEELLAPIHQCALVHLSREMEFVMHKLAAYGYFGVAIHMAHDKIYVRRKEQELKNENHDKVIPLMKAAMVNSVWYNHVVKVMENSKNSPLPVAIADLLFLDDHSFMGNKRITTWAQYGMCAYLMLLFRAKENVELAQSHIGDLPVPLRNYVSIAAQVWNNKTADEIPSLRETSSVSRVSSMPASYVTMMQDAVYYLSLPPSLSDDTIRKSAEKFVQFTALTTGFTIRDLGPYDFLKREKQKEGPVKCGGRNIHRTHRSDAVIDVWKPFPL